MTMWRSNEPVEDDVSDLPGIGFQNKCRRARRRAWRDGLSDQTVVKSLKNVRSYRAFERALVGSVDPRPVLELALVHRLATAVTIPRPAAKNRRRRPCARRPYHGRIPAPSPNASCVFPILTRPCLTAWAATKRDCGAKPRKPSGALRLCDSRHWVRCDGHFANPGCSLIGMPSARE
jgi:hypothetical protein